MARMNKSIPIAMMASLLALPLVMSPVNADAASCGTRKFNGALLGAAGGALVGGAVTHGSTGPIIGGLAGAAVGHEVGRSGCARRTYYRSSSARPAYRGAPTRYYAPPREEVRRVHYYDEYGRPVYR